MDLKEYREGNRKEMKLPSGLEVTIRKLTPLPAARLVEYLRKHNIQFGANVDPMDILPHLQSMANILLPACVLVPKVAEIGSEEILGVDEIAWDDLNALIGEIMDFSGLTEKPDVASFRKESTG